MTCPACSNTRGAKIVARASAGAAMMEAREAVKKAQTALRHAGGKSRKADAEKVLVAAEERRRQAESDYQAARAAEDAVM